MITDASWLIVELIGLFIGVAFLVQLGQRRLGPDRLQAWMGGTPVSSALKGIAIGFITPFCTYSAIPMLVGLRQAGVPPAGYVAFITAAPVLDPMLFGALVVIVGPQAAGLYAAIAFCAALTSALAAQRVGIERYLKPLGPQLRPTVVHAAAPQTHAIAQTTPSSGVVIQANAGEAPTSDAVPACGVDETPWQGLRIESRHAATTALMLLRSVAWLVVAGVAVGVAIETAISPEDVAMITGNNGALSIPIAAALGTPLYVQTSLFIPIADALSNAGVGIGAIVALTISGAGANVPEFIILSKLAVKRLVATFFAYVFTVALIGGLVAQALLG